MIEYPGTAVDAITAATVAFQNNVTDPKATIITAYTYIPALETVRLIYMPLNERS